MYGGLKEVVKEEIARLEAIKQKKLQMESSEYFKDHVFQKKEDKKHDKDFHVTELPKDTLDPKERKEVTANNEKEKKTGKEAEVYKDGEEAEGQDFYNDEQKGKEIENNQKDTKIDANDFSEKAVKWYETLKQYKKDSEKK